MDGEKAAGKTDKITKNYGKTDKNGEKSYGKADKKRKKSYGKTDKFKKKPCKQCVSMAY